MGSSKISLTIRSDLCFLCISDGATVIQVPVDKEVVLMYGRLIILRGLEEKGVKNEMPGPETVIFLIWLD